MILSAVATDVASIVRMDGTLRQMLPLVELGAEFDRNLDPGSVVAIAPGVFCLGGIFFLHFGLPMAIAIRNVSLLGSVGIAMAPLLRRRGREGLPTEIPA